MKHLLSIFTLCLVAIAANAQTTDQIVLMSIRYAEIADEDCTEEMKYGQLQLHFEPKRLMLYNKHEKTQSFGEVTKVRSNEENDCVTVLGTWHYQNSYDTDKGQAPVRFKFYPSSGEYTLDIYVKKKKYMIRLAGRYGSDETELYGLQTI